MTSQVHQRSEPTTFEVVPAKSEDLASIRQLLREVHFDSRNLMPAHFMIARSADESIIGCAQIKPIGGQQVLSSVAVAAHNQGAGIGRAIIHALLAREAGPVVLMCYGKLVPYYESFGFQVVRSHTAPLGLYWRWVILSIHGKLRLHGERVLIMRRSHPTAPGATLR